MTQRPKFLRRKMFIRPGQFTYGLAFALFAIAVSTGLVVAALMIFQIPSSVPCPDGTEGCTAIVLAPTDTTGLVMSIALMTIPATLISFLLGIILSHRTFGPIVRMRYFVDELVAGNYSARIKLRDGDHLGELAQMFNELAEKLEQKHPPKDKT